MVLGALISAFGSWWLERRRDSRRLAGVLGLLATELDDNRKRIEARRRKADGPIPRKDWGVLLTLGNWDANKAAFAQLMHDESLWGQVVRTYAEIFEAISARQDPPKVEELTALARKLAAERDKRLPRP